MVHVGVNLELRSSSWRLFGLMHLLMSMELQCFSNTRNGLHQITQLRSDNSCSGILLEREKVGRSCFLSYIGISVCKKVRG